MVSQRVRDLGQICIGVAGGRAAGKAVCVRIAGDVARARHVGASTIAARVFHSENLASLIVSVGANRIRAVLGTLEAFLRFCRGVASWRSGTGRIICFVMRA